jgi:hypothetical protein
MSSIRKQMTILFAGLGTLSVVVVIIGTWRMSAANSQVGEAYLKVTLPTEYPEGTDWLQLLSAIMAMNAIASDDPAVQKDNADAAATLREESDRQFNLFRQATKSAEIAKLAEKFIQDRELAMSVMREVVRLLRSGEERIAQDVLNKKVRFPGPADVDDIERLIPLLRDGAARSYQDGIFILKHSHFLSVGVILIRSGVVGFFVWNQITSLGLGLMKLEKTLVEVSETLDL